MAQVIGTAIPTSLVGFKRATEKNTSMFLFILQTQIRIKKINVIIKYPSNVSITLWVLSKTVTFVRYFLK